MFLTGKYKDSVGTSLECAELIYVKITENTCVSDELCRFKEEEEEEEGDSRINRVLDRLTVRVYSDHGV